MTTSNTTLRQTPLASRHAELGARMVDFGGWEMPIHYGSQLDEHHAVRKDAGMFDVSHMCVVDAKGKGVVGFLQAVLANNVAKLTVPGKALYTCMLNPHGGILDDLIVYFQNETSYRLIVNAATAQQDIDWLKQQAQRLQADVVLTPLRTGDAPSGATALGIIAIQGPTARARTWTALPEAQAIAQDLKPFHSVYYTDAQLGEIMIARTGYTGEDGHELIVAADQVVALWNRLLEAGARPAGLGARDTLRLEAGMNLYGQDMDEQTSPLDCGLGWTVDMEGTRDFIGKSALQEQGQGAQMIGLVSLDRAGILRAGQQVDTPEGPGQITSGTFSPTMQQSIALARLPIGVQAGAEVQVQVRGKSVRARVVRPPFVRNGQVKV